MNPAIFSNLNHLHVDTVYAEFLFHLIHATKVPTVYDPSGAYINTLTSELVSSYNIISASNYHAEKILNIENSS